MAVHQSSTIASRRGETNFLRPWRRLCRGQRCAKSSSRHYPKAGNCSPPIGLERMLLIQHWVNLADLACEEALYDSAGLRRFVGIDLGREPAPGAITRLMKFRRLLNNNKARRGAVCQGGATVFLGGLFACMLHAIMLQSLDFPAFPTFPNL